MLCNGHLCLVVSLSAGDFAVSWMSQSMTSSLQLAEECLKDDASSRTLPEGLEAFAQTIESGKVVCVYLRRR